MCHLELKTNNSYKNRIDLCFKRQLNFFYSNDKLIKIKTNLLLFNIYKVEFVVKY